MMSATPNGVSAKDHDPARDLIEAKLEIIASDPLRYYADVDAVERDRSLSGEQRRMVTAMVINKQVAA